MIGPALVLAISPLPDVADILDCAREERVTLVAAFGPPAAGVAFQSIEVTELDSLSAGLEAARAVQGLMIIWPRGVAAETVAEIVADRGMSQRVLLAASNEAEGVAIRAAAPEIGLLMTGIADRYEVLSSELNPHGMAAWFDYFPDAHMEYFLTGQGIATAISDFPFVERMSGEDFALIRQQHIEILITGRPEPAVAVFGRAGDHCPADGAELD